MFEISDRNRILDSNYPYLVSKSIFSRLRIFPYPFPFLSTLWKAWFRNVSVPDGKCHLLKNPWKSDFCGNHWWLCSSWCGHPTAHEACGKPPWMAVSHTGFTIYFYVVWEVCFKTGDRISYFYLEFVLRGNFYFSHSSLWTSCHMYVLLSLN